jgi:predicted RNase H-like HicB family nuclease
VKTYTVHAVRSQGWWGLTVPEVPGAVSQVRSLASAEEYVREAIAFIAGTPGQLRRRRGPQLPGALAEKSTGPLGRGRAGLGCGQQPDLDG